MNALTLLWNSLNGRTVFGAMIVCGWFRSEYCMVSPMSADFIPPSSEDALPVTGSVRLIVSRRIVLSLVPVQMSTLGFLIAAAILLRSAAGNPGLQRARAGDAERGGLREDRVQVARAAR